MSLIKLKSYLNDLPAGPVQDNAAVEDLLATAWGELKCRGDDERTRSWKLQNRTEQMKWEPPFLRFSIERHGAVARGSSRAEVHHWVVNLESRTRTIEGTNKRQIYRMAKGLDVQPIAIRLAKSILSGSEDPALTWYPNGAKVVISMPKALGDACEQTMQHRRKRFQDAIEPLLKGHGWIPGPRRGCFLHATDQPTEEATEDKRMQLPEIKPVKPEHGWIPKPKTGGTLRPSDQTSERARSGHGRTALPGFCNWPGCGKHGYSAVDGVDHCPEHATTKRRQILQEGLPTLTFDEQGRPVEKGWLAKFAYLAAEHMTELTQAKIRDRGILFVTSGSRVSFSIDRHPTGLVVRQRWEYDIATGDFKKLGEQTIKSNYKWNEVRKYYECPKCGAPLKLKPGAVRCLAPGCDYADFHEHSLGL